MKIRVRSREVGASGLHASLAASALGMVFAMVGCGSDVNTTTGTAGKGGSNAGGSAGAPDGGAAGSNAGGSNAGGSNAGGSAGMSAGGSAGTSAGGAGGSAGTGTGGAFPGGTLCKMAPPAGATLADELPVYGGSCPMLVAGENTINSSGSDRKFVLVLPMDLKADENPPVIFLWHWLGGSAEDFIAKGEIQAAVDQQRFVAVVPRSKGDVKLFGGDLQWPYDTTQSDARQEEEYKFFDDMLACVGAQFKVNKECVGSAGVSAGALFTDQLAAHRDNHIASFLSLSGGVGGVIKPWGNPKHKLPGLVLWGGPTDSCFNLLNFQDLSHTLEDNLASQGNFFIECVHNCGHAAPPLDPPAAGSSIYESLWNFVLDHPYWVKEGDSPYKQGLPANLPEWCGIGKNSATPRMGPCEPGGC